MDTFVSKNVGNRSQFIKLIHVKHGKTIPAPLLPPVWIRISYKYLSLGSLHSIGVKPAYKMSQITVKIHFHLFSLILLSLLVTDNYNLQHLWLLILFCFKFLVIYATDKKSDLNFIFLVCPSGPDKEYQIKSHNS